MQQKNTMKTKTTQVSIAIDFWHETSNMKCKTNQINTGSQ